MQITLNRRGRTLVTSRLEGDALIGGTISSTVSLAAILVRRLYPGALCTMHHRRNRHCCPLRKSHYRAYTRAYVMLSRSARCAFHCVAMVKQMRVSAPFIRARTAYRSLVVILNLFVSRVYARWRNNFVRGLCGIDRFCTFAIKMYNNVFS